MTSSSHQLDSKQLADDFRSKLIRFRVDDLFLVVSISLALDMDKVVKLLTDNGQCLAKEEMIEKIMRLIPHRLFHQMGVMVDFLSSIVSSKVWTVYALETDGVVDGLTEMNVNDVRDKIEKVFASAKMVVSVDVLRFMDRFIIQICMKDKKTHFQYFPELNHLWARSSTNKRLLKLTIKSLGSETMTEVREEHKKGCELSNLWLRMFTKSSNDTELLEDDHQSKDSSESSNRTNRSRTVNTSKSMKNDFLFIEQNIPRTQTININVKNAKLGSAIDFPALKSEIDQDSRFDFRITIKSKSIKRTLKKILERGDLFNGNCLPAYIRNHYEKSSLNEINYTVPEFSDDEDEDDENGTNDEPMDVDE